MELGMEDSLNGLTCVIIAVKIHMGSKEQKRVEEDKYTS